MERNPKAGDCRLQHHLQHAVEYVFEGLGLDIHDFNLIDLEADLAIASTEVVHHELADSPDLEVGGHRMDRSRLVVAGAFESPTTHHEADSRVDRELIHSQGKW